MSAELWDDGWDDRESVGPAAGDRWLGQPDPQWWLALGPDTHNPHDWIDEISEEPPAGDPRLSLRTVGVRTLSRLAASRRLAGLGVVQELQELVELARPGVAGDPTGLVDSALLRLGVNDATYLPEIVAAKRADLTVEYGIVLAAAEAGKLLGVAPRVARDRVEEALDLCTNLRVLVAGIENGELELANARIIAQRTSVLPQELREKVARQVLARGAKLSARTLKALVDTLVVQADPAAAEARRQQALARRKVGAYPADDGMSTFTALIPAEDSAVVLAVLRQIARDNDDPNSSADAAGMGDTTADGTPTVRLTQPQREADGFVDIFQILSTGGTVSLRPGGHTSTSRADNGPKADTASRDAEPSNASGSVDSEFGAGDDPAPSMFAGLTWTDIGFVRTPGDAATPTAEPSAQDDLAGGRPEDQSTPEAERCSETDSTRGDVAALDTGDTFADTDNGTEVGAVEVCGCDPGTQASADPTASLTAESPADNGPSDRAEIADEPVEHSAVSAVPVGPTGAWPPDPENDSAAATPIAPISGVPGAPTPSHRQQCCAHHCATETTTPAGLPGFALPTRQGRSTHLVITVSAETLAGLNDDPGMLADHGVMTAQWCRQIADTARTFTVVAVDTRGRPVDCSPTQYRPRQAVRDRIITLHPTCVFPDCGTSSRRVDLDHIEPFDHHHPERGGPTTPENLAPVCRHHHLLKTHGGWTYHRTHDAFVWTSPLGQQLTSPIAPLLHTAAPARPAPPERPRPPDDDPPPF